MALGLTETLLRAAAGLMVRANVAFTLAREAVMVTGVGLVTLPAVTVKVAEVAPCSTVTDAGTAAAAVLELESAIVKGPALAAAVSVTVPLPDCPLTIVDGLTERVLGTTGAGLTVTPAVILIPK